MTLCKRCNAEIEFKEILTRDGKKYHPFNKGTNTSHFDTCPYADEFRPKKPIEPTVMKNLDLFW